MSELIRRDEVQRLIESIEVNAYAFKILDEELSVIPTIAIERDCNGCMGASFNDCDRCEKILRHYGGKEQLVKAAEELAELQLILLQDHNKGFIYDISEVYEELADVYIMLEQIKLIYNIDETELNAEIEYKLDRQIKRIESE